jgi:iron(II)-dependent oxidoreductase
MFVADNVAYSDNSNESLSDIGSCPGGVSWVGAHDMSGNIWEWTSSAYDHYPYSAIDGREHWEEKTDIMEFECVLRGGSFNNGKEEMRSTCRNTANPASELYNIGFRCALSFGSDF